MLKLVVLRLFYVVGCLKFFVSIFAHEKIPQLFFLDLAIRFYFHQLEQTLISVVVVSLLCHFQFQKISKKLLHLTSGKVTFVFWIVSINECLKISRLLLQVVNVLLLETFFEFIVDVCKEQIHQEKHPRQNEYYKEAAVDVSILVSWQHNIWKVS